MAGEQDSELAGSGLDDRARAKTEFPADVQARIDERRLANQIMAAIAGMSWGKGITVLQRRAIADYCRRYDVDPVTEIDYLGGNVYVNADYYLRKLGDLRRARVVKDFWLEHIHADPRMVAVMKDQSLPEDMRANARGIWYEKLKKRIEFNVPEEAEAACVCSIDIGDKGHPIQGCKWGGGGTSVQQPKHGGGSSPNPIVENNPALSVESQSVRRAMRQLMSHISGNAIVDVDRMDQEIRDISRDVAEAAATQEAGTTGQPAMRALPEPDPLGVFNPRGEYNRDEEILQEQAHDRERFEAGEFRTMHATGERTTEAQRVASTYASAPSPYGITPDPLDAPIEFPKPVVDEQPGAERVELSVATASEKPAPDIFGGVSHPEPVREKCSMCHWHVRADHPEDHDPDKSCYADPDS